MNIDIVFINGISKEFFVTNNESIKNLKQSIVDSGFDELSNIGNAVCVLKYKGIDLDDELSLYDYNIQPNERIHFLVRSQPININKKDSPTVYESISSSPAIVNNLHNIGKKDRDFEIFNCINLINDRLTNLESDIKYLTKCFENKERENTEFIFQ